MNLRQSRFLKADMKQVELAKLANVFQSRISDHERGFLQLRKDEKERIESCLNLQGCINWDEKQQNMREEKS